MEPKICSGYLIKSPRHLKAKRWSIFRPHWRRRYFVLSGSSASSAIPGTCPALLCYYDDERMVRRRGTIDLENCEEVVQSLDCPVDNGTKQAFALKTRFRSDERIYYLVADSEAEMCEWVRCICRVLNLDESSAYSSRPTSSANSSRITNSAGTEERYVTVPLHGVIPVVTSPIVPSALNANSSINKSGSNQERLNCVSRSGIPPRSQTPEGSGDYIHLDDCHSGSPLAPPRPDVSVPDPLPLTSTPKSFCGQAAKQANSINSSASHDALSPRCNYENLDSLEPAPCGFGNGVKIDPTRRQNNINYMGAAAGVKMNSSGLNSSHVLPVSNSITSVQRDVMYFNLADDDVVGSRNNIEARNMKGMTQQVHAKPFRHSPKVNGAYRNNGAERGSDEDLQVFSSHISHTGSEVFRQTENTRSYKRSVTRVDEPALPMKKPGAGSVSSGDEDDDDADSVEMIPSYCEGRVSPFSHRATLSYKIPGSDRKSGDVVQYADLDLEVTTDGDNQSLATSDVRSTMTNQNDIEYKEIDQLMTKALAETKREVETLRKNSEKSTDT